MKWYAWLLSTCFMVASVGALVGWFDPAPWEYALVALSASVLWAVVGVYLAERIQAKR